MNRVLTVLVIVAVVIVLHLLVRAEITAYQDLRTRVEVAEKQAEIRGMAVVKAYDELQLRNQAIAYLQEQLSQAQYELQALKPSKPKQL